MKLRMSWALMAFMSALALSRQAENNTPSFDGDDKKLRVAMASLSTDSPTAAAPYSLKALASEIEDGERSAEEIQTEVEAFAGTQNPIAWNTGVIRGTYKLKKILHHIQNLDSNTEILALHVLPDLGQEELSITRYTHRVFEAQENIFAIEDPADETVTTENPAAIVVSRLIEVRDDRPVFDEKSQARYAFSFQLEAARDRFSLGRPRGGFKIDKETQNAFTPLAILTNENGNFNEVGEYLHEIETPNGTYSVSATPRATEYKTETVDGQKVSTHAKTITIEIQIREVNSLVTNSFVLVYEEI